jgi:galactokinase
MLTAEMIQSLESAPAGQMLSDLYGSSRLAAQKLRYARLIERFVHEFPQAQAACFFSTPGRTEVGGNHTDHNAGRVLAAAVDLDVLTVAGKCDDGVITILSEGYPKTIVDSHHLEAVAGEKYTTAALVRGVCARMVQLGYKIGGFQACMNSDVPKGSGLSSSAAFEVEVVTILDSLYNQGQMDPVLKAQISQFAENQYFGKPSGLMDQTSCSVGGFVTIDFKDASRPVVHKVDYDFSSSGYVLVVVETGGDHADLNEEYASIQREMHAVATVLGGNVLREIPRQSVIEHLGELRAKVGDRAILRAIHFYDDDARVVEEVDALEAGRFDRFLELVKESGRSSWMLLQNNFATKNPAEQGIALAQVLSAGILGSRGAWRVHGGGFAGTIQAFVPQDLLPVYLENMQAAFGKGTCYPISIRSAGSMEVKLN